MSGNVSNVTRVFRESVQAPIYGGMEGGQVVHDVNISKTSAQSQSKIKRFTIDQYNSSKDIAQTFAAEHQRNVPSSPNRVVVQRQTIVTESSSVPFVTTRSVAGSPIIGQSQSRPLTSKPELQEPTSITSQAQTITYNAPKAYAQPQVTLYQSPQPQASGKVTFVNHQTQSFYVNGTQDSRMSGGPTRTIHLGSDRPVSPINRPGSFANEQMYKMQEVRAPIAVSTPYSTSNLQSTMTSLHGPTVTRQTVVPSSEQVLGGQGAQKVGESDLDLIVSKLKKVEQEMADLKLNHLSLNNLLSRPSEFQAAPTPRAVIPVEDAQDLLKNSQLVQEAMTKTKELSASWRTQLEERDRTISEQLAEIASLKAKLAQKKEKLKVQARVAEELAPLKQEVSELREVRATIEVLKKELGEARREREKMVAEGSSRQESLVAARQALQDQLDTAQTELTQTSAMTSELENQLMLKDNKLASVNRELEATRDRLSEVEQAYLQMQHQKQEFVEAFTAESQKMLDLATAENESLKKSASELKAQIEGERKLFDERENELLEALHQMELSLREKAIQLEETLVEREALLEKIQLLELRRAAEPPEIIEIDEIKETPLEDSRGPTSGVQKDSVRALIAQEIGLNGSRMSQRAGEAADAELVDALQRTSEELERTEFTLMTTSIRLVAALSEVERLKFKNSL